LGIRRPKNTVKSKWIFKLKLATNGIVARYKARLLAKGFTQQKGIDYKETFSPIAKMDSICIVISIAIVEGLNVTQFDIRTAFLNGNIDEVIYMDQLVRFEIGIGKFYRLKKALYGLKQSARQWNSKFNHFLKAYDLMTSVVDCCVYVNKQDPKLIFCIWVDDDIVCSTYNDSIRDILSYMEKAFKITAGLVEMYVGLHISKDRDQKLIHLDGLDQHKYLEHILKQFGHEDCNSVAILSDPNNTKHLKSVRKGESKTIFPYHECVGSL
jgi:hypothetical protein